MSIPQHTPERIAFLDPRAIEDEAALEAFVAYLLEGYHPTEPEPTASDEPPGEDDR